MKTESHRLSSCESCEARDFAIVHQSCCDIFRESCANYSNLHPSFLYPIHFSLFQQPQIVRTSLIFSLPFCTAYNSHVTTSPNAGLLPLAASEPIIPYIFSTSRGLEDFGNLHPVTKSTIPFSGRQGMKMMLC